MSYKKIAGIYYIKNLINGKIYVGQAVDIRRRFGCHRYALRRKKRHENQFLQRAWNKYGESNFEFGILQTNVNHTELTFLEQYYVDLYKANNHQ